MGNPLNEKTDIGTVISKQQHEKITSYIEHGRNERNVVTHVCCELPQEEELKNGLFHRPVVFTNISNDSKVAKEEIFGPVCCVVKWNDFDDVIRQANDTCYGLSSSIWTKDLKLVFFFFNFYFLIYFNFLIFIFFDFF